MVGATQAPLTLGGGLGIPSFPTTFSNINPQPATSPIRFGAGGTAEMGAGGANVRYPSNLGIAGGQYGPLEMGARDFSPARLPQAQSPSMFGTVPFTPFTPRAERMAPALSTGLTPLPERATTIAGGPASMNIAGPMTAEAQGRQAIQTPYGNIYATQQQAANMMTPRTAAQQGSRTPEQQQALIAQMRERGSALGKQFAQDQESFFTAKRSENKLITDLVGEAILSGMPERQAKSMVRPYYDSQPSTFGGIKSDFENYKNIGFNKMSEFVQGQIRGMFPSSGSQRSSQIASITDTNSSANSSISTRKDRPIPLPVETGRPVPMPVETNFPWDNLNYAQLSRSPMSRIPNFPRV